MKVPFLAFFKKLSSFKKICVWIFCHMAVYTCVLVPEEASVGVTAALVTKMVVSCALGFEPGPLEVQPTLNC